MKNLFFIPFLSKFLIGIDSDQALSLCTNSGVNYDNYTGSKTEICGCEERHSCVRKCCQSGFHHFHNESGGTNRFYSSICVKKILSNFTVPVYDGLKKVYMEDKFIVGMLDCKNEDWQYFKMDNTDPRQKFYIQKNGSLYYPFYNKIYSNDRYCVDERDGLTAFLCFTPRVTVLRPVRLIHALAKVISLPFLITTFIVYAILPGSSLHGRALMCHVFSLTIGNISVAAAQYYLIQDNTLCNVLGYSVIFFMLASFFWMNVMCIDIWLAFSGLRGIYSEKRIFVLCFIYAWGIPFNIALIVYLMNTYGDKNCPLYPGVGIKYCFINGSLQVFIYYFGPILVLVIINTTFFILTAINIQRVRRETSMLRDANSRRHVSNEDNRKKFSLYWKLLFAMGINPVINFHVIQAISWSAGTKLGENADTILYIKDLAHFLYGIFIFITYVCKRNIWRDLNKRYFLFIGRPIRANSMPQTALSSLSISEGTSGQVFSNAKNKKEENV